MRYFIFLFMALLCAPVHAADVSGAQAVPVAGVEVSGVWMRPSLGNTGRGAVYMQLINRAETPDLLMGGQTPAAPRVEIHTAGMEDGIMRMRELTDGLLLPPGEAVLLQPRGYHVMLFDMPEKVAVGDSIDLTLIFANAPAVHVAVPVQTSAP